MGWEGLVARMGKGELHTGVWLRNLTQRGHLEDEGVDGSIILKRVFKKWNGGMDWFEMGQDIDMWRVLLNAVMNLLVP